MKRTLLLAVTGRCKTARQVVNCTPQQLSCGDAKLERPVEQVHTYHPFRGAMQGLFARIRDYRTHMRAFTAESRLKKALLVLPILLSTSAYGQWITGYYQAQNGYQSVSDIPWSKYTHVIHFALNPAPGGTLSLGSLSRAEIAEIVPAAHANGTKILVSILDANDHSLFATDTNPANLSTFVSAIQNFINNNGYDGVDFDWESNVNQSQYESLIAATRAALGSSKVITMAAFEGPDHLPEIAAAQADNLDQVNMECYDKDLWDAYGNPIKYTWYVDALHQSGHADKNACDFTAGFFTGTSIPRSKLGIGIPFYGRLHSGVTQPMEAISLPGTTIFYRDLSTDPTRFTSANIQWDDTYYASYLSIPTLNEFISYNGPRSIAAIVDWGKQQGFGGYMTFNLPYEFMGTQSGDSRFPLSTALYSSVFGSTNISDPAPVISNGKPSGTLSYSTSSATLSVATNENATCAYSTMPGTAYSAMPNQFSVTGGTQHSTTLDGLQSGAYQYFVRCADTQGVANTTDYKVAFTVAAAPSGAAFTPSTGSGSGATFTWEITDKNGVQAIQEGAILIAGSGGPSCYMQYWAPNTTLYLQNDAGNGWTQGTVGTSMTLQNSQCSVNLASTTASASGDVLTLKIPVTFSVSNFGGQKDIDTFAAEATNIIQGWTKSASWLVMK